MLQFHSTLCLHSAALLLYHQVADKTSGKRFASACSVAWKAEDIPRSTLTEVETVPFNGFFK